MSATATSSDRMIPPGNGLYRSPGVVVDGNDPLANTLANPLANTLAEPLAEPLANPTDPLANPTDPLANPTEPLGEPQAADLVYRDEIPSEHGIQYGRVPRTTGAPR